MKVLINDEVWDEVYNLISVDDYGLNLDGREKSDLTDTIENLFCQLPEIISQKQKNLIIHTCLDCYRTNRPIDELIYPNEKPNGDNN
jgi:hypothetical protein